MGGAGKNNTVVINSAASDPAYFNTQLQKPDKSRPPVAAW